MSARARYASSPDRQKVPAMGHAPTVLDHDDDPSASAVLRVTQNRADNIAAIVFASDGRVVVDVEHDYPGLPTGSHVLALEPLFALRLAGRLAATSILAATRNRRPVDRM